MPFPAMSPQDAAMLRLNHNNSGMHHHHPHHPLNHPSAVSVGDSPFSPFSSSSPLHGHQAPAPPPTSLDSGGSRQPIPPPPFVGGGGIPPHHLMSLNSPAAQVQRMTSTYTDKKEINIFLLYREIQMGSGARSYRRKGFLIYEEMHKEVVSHI
jgi:hypothetical protein